jgi:Tfp pilus assembly protein PilF
MLQSLCNKYICAASVRSGMRLRIVLAGCAIVFNLASSNSVAQRAVTAKDLIGDAVPEVGPKHADVDEAIKRFGKRDPLGARADLEEARKKDPTLPPTDITLAKMYFLSGNAAAGRAAIEKSASDFPNDPEPYLLFADQYFNQGNVIEADALYDKGMQLTERFNDNTKRKRNFAIRARWGRAMIAERRKKWPEMTAELEALLKIDEHHAQALYRRGIALCMQDKFEPGYRSFEAAKKEDTEKTLPNPWLATALMYDRRDLAEKAQQWFEEAIKREPKDLATITSYASWLLRANKIGDAETRLAAARISHPEALEVFTLSGVAARMNKKPKEAEDFFVTALGKAPAHVGVMNQLATLLIGQDDEQKKVRALQFAAMNAKLNAESADANITLAWVNFKLGRANEATTALRAGLQLGALSPDSSYFVAEIFSSQNRPEDVATSKRLLSEALASDQAGIFIHRKDAEELLKKLGGPSP